MCVSHADVRLVLKSGGYKISALDVEREILGLDYVSEAAVVGVEDEEWGQRVAAAVVLKDKVRLSTNPPANDESADNVPTANRIGF